MGAMGLLFNVFTLVYYVVEPFGSAASTRVGQELGASRAKAAKRATIVAMVLGMTFNLAM